MLAWSAAVALPGAELQAADSQTAGTPASEVVIDDQARRNKINEELNDLVDSPVLVPMATLREQLERGAMTAGIVPEAPGDQPLTPTGIYDRVAPSVISIGHVYKCPHCPNWHLNNATGFVIDRNGLCVTNYHVVDQPLDTAESLMAMTFDNRLVPVVEIVAANKADDIAIVRIADPSLQPVALADRAAVGTDVFIIGHPGSRHYTFSDGRVSRRFMSEWAGEKIPMLSVTADFGVGSSGAPILDAYGRVVGIVTRTSPVSAPKPEGGRDYVQMVEKLCVPVESLLKLLNDGG